MHCEWTASFSYVAYVVGLNDTRIETKRTPYRITNSGHQFSNHDPDLLDVLISTFSFAYFQILTENEAALNLLFAFGGWPE